MRPPSEPETVPPRVKRAWTVGITVGLVLLITVSIVRGARDTAENVVYDYFAAILDGDVDTALSLMSTTAQVDSEFLTAEAISHDWQLISVADAGHVGEDYETTRKVDVEIGGPDGVASGTMRVDHDDDSGWRIEDPLVRVTIGQSPLGYAQVNGYTPKPQPTDDIDAQLGQRSILLLPGIYEFYEDIPGVVKLASSKTFAALPSGYEDSEANVWTPPKVVAESKTVASARKQLKKLLRECVTTTVPRPAQCPFGAGEFVNTPDGEHVEELHDLEWTLERLPEFVLADARFHDDGNVNPDGTGQWSFRFEVKDAPALTLRGKGIDSDDKKIDFEVPCRVDLSAASATVDRDGTVTLRSTGLLDYDDGPVTCGKEL